MEKLIIKNGQFFRGGEVVPTMIGDAEQIATLKRYQRRGATKSRELDISSIWSPMKR